MALVRKKVGKAKLRIIVPANKEARRLLLPFEESDYMTSLVFSKVLMMLDDDRITDPTILRQMGRTP